MSTFLGQLLRGSTVAYNRPDCIAWDSSSTALPAPSTTAPTADGVTLANGNRVLYTALTTAGEPNNWVYVCTVTSYAGVNTYMMVPAHDSRNPNQMGATTVSVGTGQLLANGGGAPEALDMLMIDQGSTNAGKLVCFTGTAWTNTVPSTL